MRTYWPDDIQHFYFDSEEIAKALDEAGFVIRPEDCLAMKFGRVGEILGKIARQQFRQEIGKLSKLLAGESK